MAKAGSIRILAIFLCLSLGASLAHAQSTDARPTASLKESLSQTTEFIDLGHLNAALKELDRAQGFGLDDKTFREMGRDIMDRRARARAAATAGDEFFKAGRYKEASEKYLQALRLDRDDPDTAQKQAVAQLNSRTASLPAGAVPSALGAARRPVNTNGMIYDDRTDPCFGVRRNESDITRPDCDAQREGARAQAEANRVQREMDAAYRREVEQRQQEAEARAARQAQSPPANPAPQAAAPAPKR